MTAGTGPAGTEPAGSGSAGASGPVRSGSVGAASAGPPPPGPPAEVVTAAVARDVTLPRRAGTLVLITLDNGLDHSRPNTFGPAGLQALDNTLAAALDRPNVIAVAVTGKPYSFSAGADLTGVGAVQHVGQARQIAQLGQTVFGRLRAAAVPTFAFVNGAALGGGLELALSCRYRSISSAVPAVALPEVSLGIIPGWGGATLLPRLLGVETACRLIVANPLANNRMLRAPQAYELGLADVLLEPADFLEQSLRWAAGVISGDVALERAKPDRDAARWAAVLTQARAAVDAAVRGAAPAPYRALDLIEANRAGPVADGLAAEQEALADLIMSEQFRASVYAFDLVQRRAKRPTGAPDRSLARPVSRVGVVGAGLMAGQLALLFARRLLVPVVITDLDEERVERGLAYVRAEIDTQRRSGRVSPDLANRLVGLVTGSVDVAAFARCDLVVEAVFEDLDVKRAVFGDLEAVVRSDCVLATNTSSLSVTAMAAGLRHPDRVVGVHFFNPVAVMPLVEVVRTPVSDGPALATAFEVARALKKSAVLVADAPGFVVNRLLARLLGEVAGAVDAGTPFEVADRALDPLGLPMAPFELLGLVGPTVALHTAQTMAREFPARFTVPTTLVRLVEAGVSTVWLQGADGSRYVDPRLAAILPAPGAAPGSPSPSGPEVLQRTVAALAEEARLMLDEEVVAAPQDIDLCLLLGAGWPFHLGGLTPYLDRTGVAAAVTGRRFLPPGVASLPAARTPTASV